MRLATRGDASSLQAIYEGLRALGYIPHAPQVRTAGKLPEPYLRWTDPARRGPTVIYFGTRNLWFVREDDIKTLSDLFGDNVAFGRRNHNIKVTISAESIEPILRAAERIKR